MVFVQSSNSFSLSNFKELNLKFDIKGEFNAIKGENDLEGQDNH